MPKIYRAMFADGDLPMVGPDKKMLGVKIGDDEYDDIAADEEGRVVPGTGGMSVAPGWRVLPRHRIPKRLNTKLQKPIAKGSDRLHCWRYGSGDSESAGITDHLRLVVDSSRHGTVEPSERMPAERYQRCLAATAPHWTVDEE